jgi:hypothetical protein
VAIVNIIATLDPVAVLHRQRFPAWNKILDSFFVLVVRANDDALLVLIILAELDGARGFRDDRVILRTPCFEQLGNTRQTAGDVTSSWPMPWDYGPERRQPSPSSPGSTDKIASTDNR